MEEFGARDQSSEQFCPEAVKACDIFIGVLGPDYGSCPRGSRKSFCELEWDVATDAHKARLMFHTVEGFPRSSPPEAMWKQKKQAAFRKKVTQERQCAYFTSSQELAIKMVSAILNYLWSQAREAQERTLASERNCDEEHQEDSL
jgi:hypothetical protein